MKKVLLADYIYTQGKIQPGLGIRTEDGIIIDVGAPNDWLAEADDVVHLDGRVLMPGGVNVHSHAFQILLRGKSDAAADFRDWVDNYLYKLVLTLDEDAARASCLLAFTEMALCGVTTVGEFWYIHNDTETNGFKPLGNRYAEIAIACARQVGLRIGLVRTLYDQGEKPGQNRFKESPHSSAEHIRALHSAHADDPGVRVLPAPHSLHGASAEAITIGAKLAEELDTFMHIHIAEEEQDLAISQKIYGTTPVRALRDLGVVSNRLVCVHGCWLDSEECTILGSSGGNLAYNPVSNMALGDGISDIRAMIDAGVTVALGTDGACANNTVDVWREMRAVEHLQRIQKLQMSVVHKTDTGGPRLLIDMATRNGARFLGFDTGTIEPGMRADLVAFDYGDLSLSPHWGMETEPFLNNFVYSMATRSAVSDVLVDGEFIVRNHQPVHVSLDEVRSTLSKWEQRTAL